MWYLPYLPNLPYLTLPYLTLPCTCISGYSGNGSSSTDNNECNDTPKPCSSLVNCTNTPGSYMCHACPSGYSGNGTLCNGINIFPFVFVCLTDMFYT